MLFSCPSVIVHVVTSCMVLWNDTAVDRNSTCTGRDRCRQIITDRAGSGGSITFMLGDFISLPLFRYKNNFNSFFNNVVELKELLVTWL